MAKILLENDEIVTWSGNTFIAAFPFQLKDNAIKCVTDSSYGGRAFEATVLDEGLPGNPDVEYVNTNHSLIEFEQEEKLRHLQEMIVGLMVGLGIEGKVRRKKGYFKIHYEDKDEIGERVTGHIIHPPSPKDGQCGTNYYPHLIPHHGSRCSVCLAPTDDIHAQNGAHVHESMANGFSAEELRRIREAEMRRGVEEP